MKAEIIAIGSELTCGARLDTNSQWLSREMEALGWTVHRHTTVADDHDGMIRVFQEAAARSRVVLVTGGLGPTLDDITRDTLAAAFNQQLVEDTESLDHIESLFRSRGRVMPERNKVQALRPENAASIHNAHGTAPGILMNLAEPKCTIAVMPGVPTEMQRMFHEQVARQLPESNISVQRAVIRTFGYGESDAERLLGDLTARGRNPEVGITASQAVISLSITARAGSAEECGLLVESDKEEICQRLGSSVFGEGEADLPDVMIEQIAGNNTRLALLEGTTTGGLISHWLTESADSARQVVFSQILSDWNGTNLRDDERGQILNHARTVIEQYDADFALCSSNSLLTESRDGVTTREGRVMLVGLDTSKELDVGFSGNLKIFRPRAARHLLNLLRLHYLKS